MSYYGYRYYSPGMGRFLNRDPIEEQGGLNLYGFVGNDPVNAWDFLGLDFIAITSRDTAGIFFLPGHYALSFWKACEDVVEVGTEYSVAALMEQHPGIEHKDGIELIGESGWWATVKDSLGIGQNVSVIVSVIHRTDTGTELIPLYQGDDAQETWTKMVSLAESYDYAELAGFEGSFKNWPNSRYFLPRTQERRNNSNVFARYIVREAGLPMHEISARSHPPENKSAPRSVDKSNYLGVPVNVPLW